MTKCFVTAGYLVMLVLKVTYRCSLFHPSELISRIKVSSILVPSYDDFLSLHKNLRHHRKIHLAAKINLVEKKQMKNL